MAGKISLGISVVLLALVGYMWSQMGDANSATVDSEGSTDAEMSSASVGADLALAFIDEDSLFAKYQYVLDKQPGLVRRLERQQERLQTNAQQFERDAGLLQQLAQSGQVTEAEYEMQVSVLEKQQLAIQKQQQEMQQTEIDFLNDVQERVKEYIDHYCDENNLDLLLSHNSVNPVLIYRDGIPNATQAIVDGLNNEYAAETSDE